MPRCAAASVAEGRERLLEDRFDLLVTELWLQAQAGTALIHFAMRHQPHIRCLVVTTWIPEECRRELAAYRIPWLLKPYRVRQLEEAVRATLGTVPLLDSMVHRREEV